MEAITLATMLWFALSDKKRVIALKKVTQCVDRVSNRYYIVIDEKRYPATRELYLQAIKRGAIPDEEKQYKINQVTFQI